MEKIYKKDSTWYFDEYFDFLEKKQQDIPEKIREHVLNPNRYLFNTKETLHDSWLSEINYNVEFNKKKASLRICFLGAFHNKLFEFYFHNVSNLKIPKKPLIKVDLLIHQFGFENKNKFYYEFYFSNDKKIKVVFKTADLIIREIDNVTD